MADNDVKAVITKERVEGKGLQAYWWIESLLQLFWQTCTWATYKPETMFLIPDIIRAGKCTWDSAVNTECWYHDLHQYYLYLCTNRIRIYSVFINIFILKCLNFYFKGNHEYKSIPCFWRGFWNSITHGDMVEVDGLDNLCIFQEQTLNLLLESPYMHLLFIYFWL